jgi:uncharacterized protein YdhG (YjbR/CyaY superfamily)
MAKSKHDPGAVDAYLASLPGEERLTLQELRRLLEGLIPDAQQRISYGTTVIFANPKDVVGFVSQPRHLSFFTMSPTIAAAMKDEISKTHKVSGATIHFSPADPLPPKLVGKIVKARLAELAAL